MASHTPYIPLSTLLRDYSNWLEFVMATRQTIRQYDRHLTRIGKRYTELRTWCTYLRDCMHQRNLFFGQLALMLTEKVAELRTTDSANDELIRRLAYAHPVMQTLVVQLKEAFAEVDDSYQTLLNVRLAQPALPLPLVLN